MSYGMTVKKAKELEAESYVLTPQHPTGLLLVHTIAELEVIDDGKWIQITTEDERKHVLDADDEVLVVLRNPRTPAPCPKTLNSPLRAQL